MKDFIELTYQGQKFCVNVKHILRIMKTNIGATLHFRGNGCFSVMSVEESYEEVKALIEAANNEVERTVREFAEELKERCYSVKNSTFDTVQVVGVLTIDRLLKERYGGTVND